jgi:uncharacterized lipoprotein
MKKKLRALVLALASLALSAACASSRSATEPKQPEPQGEMSAEARPSALPGHPANAADVQTTRAAR